jgi:hypothetical protein
MGEEAVHRHGYDFDSMYQQGEKSGLSFFGCNVT